jgi:hypothetical protein
LPLIRPEAATSTTRTGAVATVCYFRLSEHVGTRA